MRHNFAEIGQKTLRFRAEIKKERKKKTYAAAKLMASLALTERNHTRNKAISENCDVSS